MRSSSLRSEKTPRFTATFPSNPDSKSGRNSSNSVLGKSGKNENTLASGYRNFGGSNLLAGKSTALRPKTSKKGDWKPGSDCVTLTKTQLDSLLTLVGNLNLINLPREKVSANVIETVKTVSTGTSGSDEVGVNAISTVASEHTTKHPQHLRDEQSTSKLSDVVLTRDEPIPTSRDPITPSLVSNESGFETSQATLVISSQSVSGGSNEHDSRPSSVASISKMSLMDLKKHKWQMEKAEMIAEYNPWGRPGAGAPLVIGSGARVPLLSCGQQGQLYQTTERISTPRGIDTKLDLPLELPSKFISAPSPTTRHSLPPLPQSAPVVAPVSVRSSSVFSESSIQENMREIHRKQWLRELDKQREEQKQRKQKEKELDIEYFRSDSSTSTYNYLKIDSASNASSRLPLSSTYSLASSNSSVPTPVDDHGLLTRLEEAPTSDYGHKSRMNEYSQSDVLPLESVPAAYVTNRVLTPSKYRSDSFRPEGREIGTQTEISLRIDRIGKRDIAIEVDSADPESYSARSSAFEDRPISRGRDPQPKKQSNGSAEPRPKWGVNQPERIYTKQSEKDPVYERKRKEARRRRLEQEAAMQRERPVVGASKTRSNAQLQKTHLRSDTVSLQSGSSSFRPLSEASSIYPELRSDVDTPNTDTGSLTRRQRRQWENPGAEEMVKFYPKQEAPVRRKGTSPSPSRRSDPASVNGGRLSPPVPALLNKNGQGDSGQQNSLGVGSTRFVPYTRSSVILGSREPTPTLLPSIKVPVVSDGECQTTFHPPHFEQQLSRSSSLPNTSDVTNGRNPAQVIRAGSSPYKRIVPGSEHNQGKLLTQLNTLRQELLEKQLEWEKLIRQQESNELL